MANLTDADKVLRNDVGKDIVTKLNNIATAIQTSGTTSLYVIADAFDSTATYDVGDYVIYNSSLYKCTTAVSVAGAFDPSDWEVVQVMDEIPDNLAGAIAMTQAQWDAIVDKTAWRNAHKNSYLVLTDAPNLNATANDLSMGSAPYDDGTVGKAITDNSSDISTLQTTVNSKANKAVTAISISPQTGVSTILNGGSNRIGNMVIICHNIRLDSAVNSGDRIASISLSANYPANNSYIAGLYNYTNFSLWKVSVYQDGALRAGGAMPAGEYLLTGCYATS